MRSIPLLLLVVLLAAPAVSAQYGAPTPRRVVSLDVVGPYLFGIGVAYERPVAGLLSVRGGVGIRDVSIFGGGGEAAVSASALAVGGGRAVEVDGGVGVTASTSAASRLVPHLTAGVRVRLPVGRAVGTERVIARDLWLRVGAFGIYDPGLRGSGGNVYVVPSLSAGLAFP